MSDGSSESWEQVHKRDMRIAQAQAQFMMNLGNYAKKKAGTMSRVLSIDGGGSRAVVAIEILRALELAASENGQKGQIRDMFDVIVGSGSGAFLAVALAAGLSLDQCEKLINDFATEVFGGNVLVQFIPRLFRYIKSKGWYDDSALQTLLDTQVRGKESFKPQEEKRKLTVTIVSAEDSVRLFSTNVQAGADAHLIDVSTVTTGQVLMASNALRSYFSPVIIDVGGRLRTFADGALVANNPVFNAFSEAHRIRPGPKYIVSIGTGEAKEAKKYSLSAPTCNKPVDIPGYDEHTHLKFAAFVKGQGEGASSIKYERFNPPGSDLPMDTSDLELLKRVKVETKDYLRRGDTRARIQGVMDALYGKDSIPIPPTMNMNLLSGKQG